MSSANRADRASAEILAAAGRVQALARYFPGDEYADTRAWLLGVAETVKELSQCLPASEPGTGRRNLGDDTRSWMVGGSPSMPRNRGAF